MRRAAIAHRVALALSILLASAAAWGGEPRIDFPVLRDGRHVVPIDLHVHTVFSDGLVWPTVRIDEALEEGVAAIAVTDHLEYRPHAADVPIIDRNRPYMIARDHAAGRIGVINGAEITRRWPIGHFIATFLQDANPLATIEATSDVVALVDETKFGGEASFLQALARAKDQDAFTFWAHPIDPPMPDGAALLQPVRRRALAEGLVQGIEVANPHWGVMREGLQIALDHNLAILATSDVHEPAERHNALFGNTHRATTLVLARSDSLDDIKTALLERRTVAFYNDYLIGRDRELVPLVESLLSLTAVKREATPSDQEIAVRIRNHAPVPMTLQGLDDDVAQPVFGQIDIGPMQEREVHLRLRKGKVFASLKLRVMNALNGPDTCLELALHPRSVR